MEGHDNFAFAVPAGGRADWQKGHTVSADNNDPLISKEGTAESALKYSLSISSIVMPPKDGTLQMTHEAARSPESIFLHETIARQSGAAAFYLTKALWFAKVIQKHRGVGNLDT